jgi:ribosomal protein L12E/L44/L45/RPP1/RPP2
LKHATQESNDLSHVGSKEAAVVATVVMSPLPHAGVSTDQEDGQDDEDEDDSESGDSEDDEEESKGEIQIGLKRSGLSQGESGGGDKRGRIS